MWNERIRNKKCGMKEYGTKNVEWKNMEQKMWNERIRNKKCEMKEYGTKNAERKTTEQKMRNERISTYLKFKIFN